LVGTWACNNADLDRELPASYRQLALPADWTADASIARGRDLYIQHCVLCHGERADGHGLRRPSGRRPADFTNPVWRRSTTPRQVFHAIREGVRATAMPGWVLPDDETWDLVAYVLSVADKGP